MTNLIDDLDLFALEREITKLLGLLSGFEFDHGANNRLIKRKIFFLIEALLHFKEGIKELELIDA